MDTVTQPTWKLKLQHLCPANKDLEQLFKKKKNQKVHMQIKENAISMFPYGTSSLSSLPGFRELCWASSVCSKHLLAFYSNSPPFRRCTGSDLEGYDRMRKDLRWVSGIRVLPGTGSVLSLLQDAFCCVWFLWRFLVLEQFTAATTLCWTFPWFLRVFPTPAAAGSCSVLLHVLTQAGSVDNKRRAAQTWKIYWNTTSPRLVVGLEDNPEHCPATQHVLSPFL